MKLCWYMNIFFMAISTDKHVKLSKKSGDHKKDNGNFHWKLEGVLRPLVNLNIPWCLYSSLNSGSAMNVS